MAKNRSQNTKLSLRGTQRRGNLVGMAFFSRDRHASLAMTTCFDNVSKAWLTRMLVIAVMGSIAAPALAQNCGMDEAQNHYDNMRLIEAIRLLEDCRRGNRWWYMVKAQKSGALRLLAFAYDARNEPDSSRAAVQQLVSKVDQGYRAAATDPEFFQALVREFRPRWYQKRWVQLGGAAVIGGVIAFALTRPEGPQGPQRLPLPFLPGSN